MKPKVLICGMGRHGKDTLAEILRDNYGLTFSSSSWAACEIFLFDKLRGEFGYQTIEDCYSDRHNHRKRWYDEICEFNRDDPSRLAKEIMKSSDIYVGMRSKTEYDKCLEDNVFDFIFWVDAEKRLGITESSDSITLSKDMFTMRVCNNGSLDDLEQTAKYVAITIGVTDD